MSDAITGYLCPASGFDCGDDPRAWCVNCPTKAATRAVEKVFNAHKVDLIRELRDLRTTPALLAQAAGPLAQGPALSPAERADLARRWDKRAGVISGDELEAIALHFKRAGRIAMRAEAAKALERIRENAYAPIYDECIAAVNALPD